MQKVCDYIEFLSIKKNKPYNTLSAYKSDLTAFLRYLSERNLNYNTVNSDDISRYLDYQLQSGKSKSTVLRYGASIKGFIDYLRNKDISFTVLQKQNSECLTVQEICVLFNQPDLCSPIGLRDRAIMETLYATGFKISEFLQINVDSIDFDDKIIKIEYKGKVKTAPIYDYAAELLEQYLYNVRPLLACYADSKALFINPDGKRFSRQGIWKLLKRYGSQARFNKEITAEAIRNSCAAHLISNGASATGARRILKHSYDCKEPLIKRAKSPFTLYNNYHPLSNCTKINEV